MQGSIITRRLFVAVRAPLRRTVSGNVPTIISRRPLKGFQKSSNYFPQYLLPGYRTMGSGQSKKGEISGGKQKGKRPDKATEKSTAAEPSPSTEKIAEPTTEETPPETVVESPEKSTEPHKEARSSTEETPPETVDSPGEQTAQVEDTGVEQTTEMEEQDIVQAIAGKVSEFGENEMREIDIGESKALVIRQNGEFSAIGHKCTHYGAPLVRGMLGNGRVRCPWHGACFNVKTGDIEEFPGLDSIPCFSVCVEGEDVVVRADKKALSDTKRVSAMCQADAQQDQRTFLIVGGGPASVACAETLRQEGFKGRIVLASRETDLPYDRPKLSKAMHLSASEIILRTSDFYSEHSIELQLGKEATSVDVSGKKVNFSDGVSVGYDTLLLATGSRPRTLPIKGFDLENVFLLREPSQANQIAESAAGKKVVVIGTSFIGMEVGAYLCDKAASVSCIDITAVPFERVLGDQIGKTLQNLLEENGVKFYLSAGVKEIVGEDGKVTGVTLPSGETLDAEVVIAGVGVVPATDFLKGSDVPMTGRGEVIVDEHMNATDGIYAAGDIVNFPLPLIGGNANIGHWQIAHNHGRIAARNMLGKSESFNSIPFFWTVLFGKSLRYCGLALGWDEIIYNGSVEERKFSAFFVKDDKVMAVTSLNSDPVVSQSAELMLQGKMPSGTQLKANSDLQSHL